jgi:hypothetical protein
MTDYNTTRVFQKSKCALTQGQLRLSSAPLELRASSSIHDAVKSFDPSSPSRRPRCGVNARTNPVALPWSPHV